MIEAKTDHDRWIRTLEENEKIRNELDYAVKIGTELYKSSADCDCSKSQSRTWFEYITSKNEAP